MKRRRYKWRTKEGQEGSQSGEIIGEGAMRIQLKGVHVHACMLNAEHEEMKL